MDSNTCIDRNKYLDIVRAKYKNTNIFQKCYDIVNIYGKRHFKISKLSTVRNFTDEYLYIESYDGCYTYPWIGIIVKYGDEIVLDTKSFLDLPCVYKFDKYGWEEHVNRLYNKYFNEIKLSKDSIEYRNTIKKNKKTVSELNEKYGLNVKKITLKEVEEINRINTELQRLRQHKTQIKSDDFLKNAIGINNYKLLQNGSFDVYSGDKTYTIKNNGTITKFVGDKKDWSGKIKTDTVPLADAIAIVYYHIQKDSDKFDNDKKCGNISIVNQEHKIQTLDLTEIDNPKWS